MRIEVLSNCPINPSDQSIMRHYLERQEAVGSLVNELKARSLGHRVLGSLWVRYTISRFNGLQRAAETAYPDILDPETVQAYINWLDNLSDEITYGENTPVDTSVDDAAANTLVTTI
ncbi:MAG: hypothetical protein WBP12_05865 [Candidatus Saccharimonas sp.]